MKKTGPSSPISPPSRTLQTQADNSHEHAIGYMRGDMLYGAQATLNVWNPTVQEPSEFSLSQIWVLAGTFNNDLNSIEAGWQVRNIYLSIYLFPVNLLREHSFIAIFIYALVALRISARP